MINELEVIVLKYNSVAMEYLRLENFKDAQVLLRKAEEILNNDENEIIPNRLKLLGITLNNLGCFYKKRKQPKVALSYLKRALDVELQTESDYLNLAGSYLNICVVFSSLNKHKQALNHAKRALDLLNHTKDSKDLPTDKAMTLLTSMVIVHFNIGVELEYLKQLNEALEFYETGYELSALELGSRHPLTQTLSDAGEKLSKKIQMNKRQTQSNFRNSVRSHQFSYGGNYRLPSVGRGRRVSEFF